jgi:hypothetical protein
MMLLDALGWMGHLGSITRAEVADFWLDIAFNGP